MSVAFRRESDEEHKEPKFELPIPPGANLVTRAGLAQTRAKVGELECAVANTTDDATREEARRDLRYWHTRLSTAQLMPPPTPDEAAFGSRVGYRLDGIARTIDIVGDDEADPANGRIAFSAPLARALIGAAVGETVDFAGRPDAIEVLTLAAIEDE